ncbi:hypothetical protein HYC85_006267 [Camellia sinensis]|uniref:Mediator of RNA polymerase II transcription subunit 33A n=1 Tax=Camellia sinensis TaxID=4442 RepID=A0A7J7HMG4_CAMSI|nr:hypothetical protein HYC85_006267 [Camellia sinensis]
MGSSSGGGEWELGMVNGNGNGNGNPNNNNKMNEFEERVMETVKGCEERKEPPLLWAMEVAKCVGSAGLGLPSAELGHLLVSQLCLSNNNNNNNNLNLNHLNPSLWKFLDQALSSALLSPLQILALLTSRIIKSVDVALQLSQTYRVQVLELGHAMVLCFFSIIVGLIDSTSYDWGLQMTSVDKANGEIRSEDNQNMDVDSKESQIYKRNDHRERIRRSNSFVAFELLGKLTENKKATLTANIRRAMGYEYQLNKRQLIGVLIDIRLCNSESGRFACWVPFDIYMENAMDGKQFPVTSAIDILTETINTLKVFNRASWQETFLALWLSALRLVQREREPLEGPVPHLEARLCALLSITPLAIARVLEYDASLCSSVPGGVASRCMENGYGRGMDGNDHALRRQGLISSLQVLGHYTSLLCSPASVVNAANNAASKAACFIFNSKNVKDGISGGGHSDTSVKAGGDMRHLIVEACLARKLIDTFSILLAWLCGCISDLVLRSITSSEISLVNVYGRSSIYRSPNKCAHDDSCFKEEKSAAAKILCGASLSRGWNIQEHVVHFVVKLLSPPVPPNFTASRSHLVDCMSMLSAILFGASSIDTVHILSLHGVVPEVAVSLMPLCETFGSLVPTSSPKSSTGDESSIYMVFSSAFLFLLRLWKFYRPPLEQCITGQGGAIGGELTLEYLLLLRNSRIQSHNSVSQEERDSSSNMHGSTMDKPIYIDSYPKLRAWYCQNKSCIASTLSGLCSGNPVHQVANKILNMIFWKMTKSGTMSSDSSMLSSSSSVSGSSASTAEDAYQRPVLPAWELLEAIPFVLEAILTACAHGRLSSRDLTTGLRDLIDFLPASLGAIISYFSAEVTRGIWKPVSMNGTDWPSPAANLITIESEIRKFLLVLVLIFQAVRVSPAMLPLPMAALVSLTITFKLDKSLEYIHAVAGPALENCASGCPWPSMPIISSLWSQKVRRWHDFIVVSCSRSVFRQNQKAVAQLLRSCFTSFLGSLHLSASPLTNPNGVNGLLGSFISAPGLCTRVAPGFLFLRSCRTIHHVQHVNHVIVELVANSAQELAARWASTDSNPLKSSRASLAVAIDRAKEVATLGASLFWCRNYIRRLSRCGYSPARDTKHGDGANAVSRILEGYSMAYLLVMSGACIWGVGDKPPSWAFSKRLRVVGVHMDFVAGVLDGNISLGCDLTTWKAYVSCLVGLVVSFAPVWIREVKHETLRKLATGLRGWHECELALSLLERGGVATMGSVAELVNVI